MSISASYPNLRPTLLLDFANSGRMDPRVTFSRASTATYYDAATYSLAEQNLLVQSQNFATTWFTTNASVATDSTTAPDGTSTADTITDDATSSPHSVAQAVGMAVAVDFTFSCFLQAGTSNYAFISLTDFINPLRYATVVVDLSAGTITDTDNSAGTTASSSITSVGSGWYRVSVTAQRSSTPFAHVRVGVSDSGTPSFNTFGSPTYSGSGSTIYVWGAQLERRSSATGYTPTTTQSITNYVPTLLTAANNVPRFDYDPVTREARGFLIEEQRTNLLQWSGSFRTQTLAVTAVSGAFTDGETVTTSGGGTGTYYAAESTGSSFAIYQGSGAFTGTLTGATSGQTATISSAIGYWAPATASLSIAPNIAVAPTGTAVGADWTENTSSGTTRLLSQPFTITAGQTFTLSLFVKQKPGAARHFRIQTYSAGTNGFNAYFNLTTGTVAIQTAALGTGTAVANSATITPVGNGWYRISASGTLDPAATAGTGIGFMQNTPSGSALYTGDGTSGLYIWGAQIEAGAFPTSYIPTTTTALTRSADVASVNTLSPWYNASASTIYTEWSRDNTIPSGVFPRAVDLIESATTQKVSINHVDNQSSTTSQTVYPSGLSWPFTTISVNPTLGVKAAIAFEVGSGRYAVNGALGGSDLAVASIPAFDQLILGAGKSFLTNSRLNGWLRRITYYPRRLSNAELQAITA